MAGVVLSSEFTGNQGYTWKVNIIDNNAPSDLSNTFVVKSARMSYHPDTDNITTPIIPSTYEIECYNQGGYFNSTFIPALILNQQNRFRVKVLRDTGSGYTDYWFGWILQDQVEEVEASQPRRFVLKCADGLGRLQDKDYLSANEATSVPERTTFVKIILNCISNTGLNGFFGSTDDYLVTSCDWWEDTMTYGATTDPLINAFLDINIFRAKGDDRTQDKYKSCYDVLNEVATLFNCQFYQSEGLWRFIQVGQRTGTTLKENIYDLNGNQNSATSSASYEEAVGTNTSLLSARLRDNNETFLPAAKYLKLTYQQTFLTKDLGQYKYSDASNAAQTIGTIEGLSEVGLSIGLDYFAYGDNVATVDVTRKHKATFIISLTLENQAGTTYYYSEGNGGEWTLSSQTFEFDTTEQRPLDDKTFMVFGNYNLLTKPLPVNGELTLRVYLDDFYDFHKTGGTPNWQATALSNEKWNIFANVEIDGDEVNTEGAVYSSINNNTAIGDDDTIDLGTLTIGDSQFATGRIMVNNAGTYEKTSNWREGNSGSYAPILQLLCNEALAYYNEPIQVYDGEIMHSESFQYRVNWDSTYYLPLSVEFDLISGVWSGRWWAIVRDKSNVAAETKIEKRKRLFRRTKSNINESSLPDGMIGGVEFEQGSGQFEETIDYEITPALMLTGVAGATLVSAGGSGTYIVPTKVLIIKTDGTIDYGSGNASIYFASETTDVISAGGLLTAINTGLTKQFNPTDETKFFANEDLLISIGSDASGDYDFTIKVYYKLISL